MNGRITSSGDNGLPAFCYASCWHGMSHVDVGGNCRFLYEDSYLEINSILNELMDNPGVYDKMKSIALTEGRKKFSYSEISKQSIKTQ